MNLALMPARRPRRLLRLALILIAAVMFVPAPPAMAGTVSFADGTFAPADWQQIIIIYVGTGGLAQSSQIATGGNPGFYRLVHNDLNPASTGSSAAVYAFHGKVGATFNPSTQGALMSINWQTDFRVTSPGFPGAAMAFGPALRQGGVIYYHYQAQSNTAWQTHAATGLTAVDFVPYGGTSHPDFSLLGGPIEFGFFTANGNSSDYAGYINEAGFDNWSMTVTFDSATPVREETWGAIKALYR